MYVLSVSDSSLRRMCIARNIAGQLKLVEDSLFKMRKPHAHVVRV